MLGSWILSYSSRNSILLFSGYPHRFVLSMGPFTNPSAKAVFNIDHKV